MPKPSDEPSEVSNEEGAVHIEGPDGIDVAMTPAAALETARRLDTVAIDAILEGIAPKSPPEGELSR
jgi:hypothetical protein